MTDNTSASPAAQATRRLALSLILTLGFVIIEVLAGLWSNSLALLTDSAHNFTDVIALGLSWYALRLAQRPPDPRRTYGYHRAGILVALVNSATLVLISLGIFWEAYRRLLDPPVVQAGVLAGVGALAFVVNLVTAWLIHKGSDHDLNLRSAFLHLMGDVISTLGAALVGVAILFTGLNWLDPLASLLIGLLILWNAWGILRETVSILLESTPRDIDLAHLASDLSRIDGVRGVHDLHVWSLTQSLRAFSAHVVIDDLPLSHGTGIRRDINRLLHDTYGIHHTTLQFDSSSADVSCQDCPLLDASTDLAPHYHDS